MLNHYVEPEDRLSEKAQLLLKTTLVEYVRSELDKAPADSSAEYAAQVRKLILSSYQKLADEFPLTKFEQTQVFSEIENEIVGFGPIQPLLEDPDISEIMIYGPEQVYIEKNGKLEDTSVKFRDTDHLMSIINRILSPLGQRVDQDNLMADARLPDGSRVNIAVPPVTIDGPSIDDP